MSVRDTFSLRESCLDVLDSLDRALAVENRKFFEHPLLVARMNFIQLGYRLRGKRTPDVVRRHPLVQAILTKFEWIEDATWDVDVASGDDTNARWEPERKAMEAFIASRHDLRAFLADTLGSENARELGVGQLALIPRGGDQNVVTVTLPVAAMPRLEALLAEVHGQRQPVTLEALRTVCRSMDQDLRAHHALRIWCYGSVATGDATGASDVDLLIEADAKRVWPSVSEIQLLMEDRLGCLVDAWNGSEASAAKRGAVLVWEATAKAWSEMTIAERLQAGLGEDAVVRRWQDGLDVVSAVHVLRVTDDGQVHLASIPDGAEQVLPLGDVISVERVPA